MLKTKAVTIDGTDYVIRQASVFRTLKFEKDLKAAHVAAKDGDNDAVVNLILDLVTRCTVMSATDATPRFTSTESFDDISWPQLNQLQQQIIAFSSAGGDGESFDDAVKAAEKNSTTTSSSTVSTDSAGTASAETIPGTPTT